MTSKHAWQLVCLLLDDSFKPHASKLMCHALGNPQSVSATHAQCLHQASRGSDQDNAHCEEDQNQRQGQRTAEGCSNSGDPRSQPPQNHENQQSQQAASGSADADDVSDEAASKAATISAAILQLNSMSSSQSAAAAAACATLADLASSSSGIAAIMQQADAVVPALLQCLSLTQPHNVMAQAAGVLASLTDRSADSSEAAIAAIVQHSRALHVLLGALAGSGSDDVARPASLVLSNLALWKQGAAAIAKQPGAVGCLVLLLNSSDPLVAEHAATALESLAWRKVSSEAVSRQPAAVQALIAALSHASDSIAERAAATLGHLVKFEVGYSALLQHAASIIPALSSSLTHSSMGVRRWAASIFESLTVAAPGNATVLKDATAVAALLACLAAGCATAASAATTDADNTTICVASALGDLAGLPGGPEAILQAGGPPVLISALKHSHPDVVYNTAYMLKVLAESESGCDAITAAGAPTALLPVLAADDAQIAAFATLAVAGLAATDAGEQAILHADGASALVACLDHVNDDVVTCAAWAMDHLAHGSDGAAALLQVAGTMPKLAACLKRDMPVAEAARDVLELLMQHDGKSTVPGVLSGMLALSQEVRQLGSLQESAHNLQEAIIGAAGQLSRRT